MEESQPSASEAQQLKAAWVAQAETILGAGRGHLGVINHLRSQGLSADKAKEVSYNVFDEAVKRLRRSQRPHRVFAWFLIALGIVVPIGLLLFGGMIVIYSGAPIVGGMLLLGKLRKPSRLPEG